MIHTRVMRPFVTPALCRSTVRLAQGKKFEGRRPRTVPPQHKAGATARTPSMLRLRT